MNNSFNAFALVDKILSEFLCDREYEEALRFVQMHLDGLLVHRDLPPKASVLAHNLEKFIREGRGSRSVEDQLAIRDTILKLSVAVIRWEYAERLSAASSFPDLKEFDVTGSCEVKRN